MVEWSELPEAKHLLPRSVLLEKFLLHLAMTGGDSSILKRGCFGQIVLKSVWLITSQRKSPHEEQNFH